MSKHKLQKHEIALDLGEFLPNGRQFWWSSEVDEMIDALCEHMPAHIGVIMTAESARSHVNYQVLHVRLISDIPEQEFRERAGLLVEHYKTHSLHSGSRSLSNMAS